MQAASFVYKRHAEIGEAPQKRDLDDFIDEFAKKEQISITNEDRQDIFEALRELNFTEDPGWKRAEK